MKLRDVTIGDARCLFEWANDKETRRNSFSEDEIKWENHIIWLKNKLEDSNCYFYILEDNDTKIGVIRLDVCKDLKEIMISYSIDHNMRNKGYGTQILMMAEKKLEDFFSGYVLVGEVKSIDNRPSIRCFENNGFVRDEDVVPGGKIVFRKKI